jgi:hypothetical protein
MSIVPSPGQMGPGTGGIGSVGAVLMKHPTLFKGLGMGPALTGLGTVLYLGDLHSARREGFGNDVQEYRRTMSDKVYAQLIIPTTSLIVTAHHELFGISSTPPGGGGPGDSPISTVVPSSIEETGEILSNPPSAPYPEPQWLQKGRARVLKETRCPKGFRWSDRYKRCVRKTEMWRRQQRKG